MTTSQFFILLGTIYLVPNMSPTFRHYAGIMFMILGLLVFEFF